MSVALGQTGSEPLEIRCGGALIRIDALKPDLLRLRFAPGGTLPEDASWVTPADLRAARTATRIERGATSQLLATGALMVEVDTRTARLRVALHGGETIVAGAAGASFVQSDGSVSVRLAMAPHERFFALGDKTGPLDRRGRRFVNWTTDQNVTPEADPLYKAIPFAIGAGGPGGCWGLLLDESRCSTFDFGCQEADVLTITAEASTLDLYLAIGPDVKSVVERSADCLGLAALPPRWAFGYQQSRWSYGSAEEVRAIAHRLREGHIPTDVIWLDIGFQDRNRPFTTDPARFPDLGGLVAELRSMGLATVAITDMHVAALPGEDYPPYESGVAVDAFVRMADGSPFVGPVWPGPAVFPDFCRADVRDWWGGLYADFAAAGVAGFWIDMNEPCVFDMPGKTLPGAVRQRIATPGFAERTTTHAEVHNLTGLLNAQATYQGLERLRPDERPFVMTRSTFAGGQKWAVTWTGDNDSSWEQLKLAVAQVLNLGLSGFAFTAVDIGGFLGEPSPELLTRWIQVGAFMPLMRNHTAEGTPPQEPWVHGPEHEALRRTAIEERYRLAPTFYALAEEAHRSGAPMMRPLFYACPELLDVDVDTSMTFLLGDVLLVAASPMPSSSAPYRVPLPPGRWFDYWSGAEIAVTGMADTVRVTVETPRLDRLPVYVRDGTILVRQPLTRALSEPPSGALDLDIWAGSGCRTTLYDDDGHSNAFKRGVVLRQEVSCRTEGKGVVIDFSPRHGTYDPPWGDLHLTLHGWKDATAVCHGLGDPRSVSIDPLRQTASVTVPAPAGAATLHLLPR